jgi:GNAT-family acetyltransferase (TIGR03103 family)
MANKQQIPQLDPDDLQEMASLKHWGEPPDRARRAHFRKGCAIDCGWGRLLFGQTFTEADELAEELQSEQQGRRDVALYVREPHVVLSRAPHALFLDPSHTFRVSLGTKPEPDQEDETSVIRPAQSGDGDAINTIYQARKMVPLADDFVAEGKHHAAITILVSEDTTTGTINGVVMGIDHKVAFDDPDNGSSLWALAVDTQARLPGVGRRLVTALASHFHNRGRSFMDLSVIHDNREAIALYLKLGFEQIPVYCVKKKNIVNESLFIGPASRESLNPYAEIIVDEARRRGITVTIEDSETGLFRLSHGGRSIDCRESLSDLTSAVAMSRCDDKALTHRLLRRGGVEVPAQEIVKKDDAAIAFLKRHGRVVVKPARGEQGQGVFVGLERPEEVRRALKQVREISPVALIEEFVTGQDLRIIVIGGAAIAAAVRKPATILGDGVYTIIELIDKQSRRRAAATRGESMIPMDEETERCVLASGYQLLDILPKGEEIAVRRTANLHTGGTIHDVTKALHPELAQAAVRAASTLQIPVVGIDFMVEAPDKPSYRMIEANERPGLANHQPAPTAEAFIDLLFPETKQQPTSNGSQAS